MLEAFKGVEKKFPWSFSGFILAVIFGALSVYLGFYKKSVPDLDYIITSNSAVLDVKEKLGELDILYKGNSLKEKNQELRFMTVRVINNGDTAITEGSYDSKLPIGFSITDGVVAEEPSYIAFSQEYLKTNLKVKKINSTDVGFNKIILDPEHYFDIKLLILYESGNNPSIKPLGKVASLDEIDVLFNVNSIEEKSFLRSSFSGSLGMQAVRIFTYGIAFFFVLAYLVTISEKFHEWKLKKKRQALVKTFKEYNESKISLRDEIFFRLYLSGSERCIQDLEYLLSNPEKLRKYLSSKKDKIKFRNNTLNVTLFQLETEEIVRIEDCALSVCGERLGILVSFIEYLRSKGEMNNYDSATEECTKDFSDDVEALKLNHLKLQGAMALHECSYAKGVSYFEEYLKANPNDPSVLWKLACCYKRLEQYADALELIEKAIRYSDDATSNYLLFYNYACYLSLNKQSVDKVMEQLEIAIEKDDGTTVISHLSTESDFENIRNEPAFVSLIEKYKVAQ
ncbi:MULTISPECIES: tetratricopeptide repeat protein [Pseudoalteromonas]|uniref:tetratricopeptide repeat protein n=1 Tax=Pseudoalteromonas TaxID=53246 RepID=UPI00073232D7|nr:MULTISPECIES: tetratricopeptide repeat protein [Pseudoalteromonas]KTF17288.1 hypothetical protein ATS74_00845 [Pseudoalteromonas sp. H103]MDO6462758.1 tetratricopeptide repeat protein [Pseudoalteromonas carrageenovora]MDO6634571.1 tetratricopeptide repeat protein [Pseudoalteromonas carrageenovora]MDO6648046.1 tetratricopeptide repeat protein [Pseudoalteromonas carrageenovora]